LDVLSSRESSDQWFLKQIAMRKSGDDIKTYSPQHDIKNSMENLRQFWNSNSDIRKSIEELKPLWASSNELSEFHSSLRDQLRSSSEAAETTLKKRKFLPESTEVLTLQSSMGLPILHKSDIFTDEVENKVNATLDMNLHIINTIRENLVSGKIEENADLTAKFNENISTIMETLDSLPGLSQLPPLPIKLNTMFISSKEKS